MTTPPIPKAMVEAAKAEFLTITGMPSTEPYDTEYATRILAAALGVCEVREEPGMRQVNADRPELCADLWADDCPSARYFQEAVKSWADMEASGHSGPWSHSALRRLHFTSPAEQVDTEGTPA